MENTIISWKIFIDELSYKDYDESMYNKSPKLGRDGGNSSDLLNMTDPCKMIRIWWETSILIWSWCMGQVQ